MYNTDLERIGVIEEISSLIWTRRYQTAGEVNLTVPYREDYAALLVDGNLLMKAHGHEAMQISYRTNTQNAQGSEEIEVRGKSLMIWLERRVILNQIVSSGLTGQQILTQLLNQNMIAPADALRRIPLTEIYPRADYGDPPISNYQSEGHAALLEGVEGLLASAGLGLRVVTLPDVPAHRFDVYRGLDLSTSQTEREPCVFSTEFDTLGVHAYTHSSEGYRNMAYVFGADGTATVGAAVAGLDRREIAVEAGDIARQYTDDSGADVTLSDDQLTGLLLQRGDEELKKMLEELTFEGTLNSAAQTKYGVDFDLGSRVTCMNRRWRITLDVRITSITETYQGNRTEISATFGEGVPSLRAAIRMAAKGR